MRRQTIVCRREGTQQRGIGLRITRAHNAPITSYHRAQQQLLALPSLPRARCEKGPDTACLERPVQFPARVLAPQHRYARAVARLERRIAVDEHAVEVADARLRQHRQGQIAEMAVVALEQGQSHAVAYGYADGCGDIE